MPVTGQEAVDRLRKFVGTGVYGLGKGGKDILSETPFELALNPQTGGRSLQCDCIGAVLWAYRCPRHHKEFPEYDGDINVDSALMDAGCIPGDHSRKSFFVEVAPSDAQVGDILMFPSVRASELEDSTHPPTTRLRIGHTGLIASINRRPGKGVPDIADFNVVECSGFLPAVKYGADKNFHTQDNRAQVVWNGKVHSNIKWRTRIVRFVRYAQPAKVPG
jgi:hypothetical protein